MTVNYNKSHVVDKMHEIGIEGENVTKQRAEKYVDLVLQSIIEVLGDASEAEVPQGKRRNVSSTLMLVNFGSFEIMHVRERKHRNPRTNEPAIKPAHRRVNFREGKMLREMVNQ